MIPISPLTDTCTGDTAQGKRYMVISLPLIGTNNSSQVVNLGLKTTKQSALEKREYNSNAQHEKQYLLCSQILYFSIMNASNFV